MRPSVSGCEHSRPPRFEFTFRQGGAAFAQFSGSAAEYLIGSDPSCDIVLDMEGVAPRHARLCLRDRALLADLDSGVGTYVDGVEITGELELRPQQAITFGYAEGEMRLERVTEVEVETEAAPVSEPAEPVVAAAASLWERPERPGDDQLPEAILEGAIAPRAGEIFDAPPVAGEEVSVTWKATETTAGTETAPSSAGTTAAGPESAAEPEAAAASSEASLETSVAMTSPMMTESVPDIVTLSETPSASDRASFLSLTNSFLLKKLAAAGNAQKEVVALTKELKKRELALVEAWSRRQTAEERTLELSQKLAQQSGGVPPSLGGRTGHRKLVWAGIAATALIVTLLGVRLREMNQRALRAESVVLLVKDVAPQLHREAQAALVDGKLNQALEKMERAVALDPQQAEYYLTLGHIHESRLLIPEAQAAYAQAVALKPSFAEAHENLDLCARILATRGGVTKLENLYGLHRLMLEQKRLAEALRMAARITDDSLILHRTWEAVLQAGGIRGDLRLNDDGTFDLDLLVGTASDLSALHGMPLRSLRAARANISDLTPLSGMALRQLDISETMVRDISVLRGMPLETLDLSNTAVASLEPLHRMPLRVLRLDYTAVTDISDLAGLPLRSLSLRSTRVQSITGLFQMPLRHLDLGRTRVKDLAALEHAPLEELNLEGTMVADLTPLTGAPLHSLTLSETRVSDLEPLRGSPLRELRLVGCAEIDFLDPLSECRELERLVLPRRGMDLSPLEALSRLRFLSYETELKSEEAAPTDKAPAAGLSRTGQDS